MDMNIDTPQRERRDEMSRGEQKNSELPVAIFFT